MRGSKSVKSPHFFKASRSVTATNSKPKLSNIKYDDVKLAIQMTSTMKAAGERLGGVSSSSLSKYLKLRRTNYTTIKAMLRDENSREIKGTEIVSADIAGIEQDAVDFDSEAMDTFFLMCAESIKSPATNEESLGDLSDLDTICSDAWGDVNVIEEDLITPTYR